jgi:hypothetical protein
MWPVTPALVRCGCITFTGLHPRDSRDAGDIAGIVISGDFSCRADYLPEFPDITRISFPIHYFSRELWGNFRGSTGAKIEYFLY